MPAPTASATAHPADLRTPASSPAPARGPGRRRSPEPPGSTAGSTPGGAVESAAEAASDVVRWAVFCCALVPVVLVVYGTSLGGAAGTAVGLAAVTAVCRVLLRRAERGLRAEAGAPRACRSHGGRNHRQG